MAFSKSRNVSMRVNPQRCAHFFLKETWHRADPGGIFARRASCVLCRKPDEAIPSFEPVLGLLRRIDT
jgi:hypothetical protein